MFSFKILRFGWRTCQSVFSDHFWPCFEFSIFYAKDCRLDLPALFGAPLPRPWDSPTNPPLRSGSSECFFLNKKGIVERLLISCLVLSCWAAQQHFLCSPGSFICFFRIWIAFSAFELHFDQFYMLRPILVHFILQSWPVLPSTQLRLWILPLILHISRLNIISSNFLGSQLLGRKKKTSECDEHLKVDFSFFPVRLKSPPQKQRRPFL